MEPSMTPGQAVLADDDTAALARNNETHLVIKNYLLDHSAEFRELTALREKGWSNSAGDALFKKQRRNADKNSAKNASYFFSMMKHIAAEVHDATLAFKAATAPSKGDPIAILDMCMAPGGFLLTALRANPGAHARCFSLPPEKGGYKVLLPPKKRPDIRVDFVDVTMLAADMGCHVVSDVVPHDHPDAGDFLPLQIAPEVAFDIAICDGQVLRTHDRAAYREPREARRLLCTQLAISLAHMKPGGTMIVLMHRVESWNTISLLHTFAQFATVSLFKPRTGHAMRSSFYMIASNIRSRSPEAERAVGSWRHAWKVATFGTEEEYEAMTQQQQQQHNTGGGVKDVLDVFGTELLSMGKDIWRIQAEALAGASFIKGL